MAAPQHASPASDLRARLETLGREIGGREASHAAAVEEAWRCAARLRAWVADALAGFQAGAAKSGASHLAIDVSEPRLDDKHLRSVQFDVRRGRHVAIVTLTSRGDVTLVGPFKVGNAEGPCFSFPANADAELCRALEDFLARFLEQATTP